MFQIGTKWYYNKQSLTSYPSHGYVVYEVVGDTLIENKSCKQVLSTSVSADGSTSKLHDKFIFYENSKSIYYYLNGKFDLMYDFGLNKGDELKVKILSDASNNPVSPLIIDSTSTIQVNGQTLKVQYVSWSYMDPFQNVIVKGERKLIESIGNEDAFLFTPSCLQSEYFAYLGLRCVSSSNMSYTSPYWSNHFKDYSCDQVVPGATSGQYQPVFGINSTKYSQLGAFGSYEYSTNGDTLISGMKYKILDYSGFVRATDDNSKMYYVPLKDPTVIYDNEYLIMDLNLKFGDKFIINDTIRYKQYYPMTIGSDTLTVDSVYNLNGLKHIRFNTIMNHPIAINGLSIKYKFEFIEGVGPNIGFSIRPRTVKLRQDNPDSGPILCSFKDNNKFFSTNLLKGTIFDGECTLKGDGISLKRDGNSISVAVDKPTNQLIIKSTNGAEQDYAIALYSANGTLLKRIDEVALPATVSLSNLTNGVYIVSLKTATSILNRKIVINRY
jgi:hypothetical protein